MAGRRRARVLLLLIAWVLALAGCMPVSRAEQPVLNQVVSLSAVETIGQSLKASYAGMQGVVLYLNPRTEQPPAGVLTLSLQASPHDESVLALAEIPLAQVQEPGYYHFIFTPQPGSSQADYYVSLQLNGSGRIDLGSAPGDAYLYGSVYSGGLPLEGQLAFQLAYHPLFLAGGLLIEGMSGLIMLLGAGFLLVLPGWALLQRLLPGWAGLGWPEKGTLSAGVGLALYPLLFLWAHLVGFAPGTAWAWAPGGLAGFFLLWQTWQHRRSGTARNNPGLKAFIGINFWPNLIFGLAMLVIFGARFWAVRSIDVPLWGDSYQHTMIAQRMIESGGLFDSWEPYVPYQSLTVQYGFPALAAVWAWLSGQDVLKAILIAGQIVNGLAVLSIYPLALWLARGNRWVGTFSLLAAGLLLKIPAIYINWGRYAQLSGQAVLLVALSLLLYLAMRKGRVGMGMIALNALVIAGMLLHYYRMAFYYVAFLPVVLVLAIPLIRQRAFSWPARLLTITATAGLSLVLLLPWLPNLMGSNLSSMVEKGMSVANPADNILGDYVAWQHIQDYVPAPILAAAGLAIVAALVLRRWALVSLALWIGLLAVVRLGVFVGMPGANMMQSFAVIIFLYVPVGLALGWVAGEAACVVVARWPRTGLAAVLLGTLLVLALGIRLQKGVANPNTFAIAVRPDLRAMQWIRSNTSEDAVFLVEGFTLYNGTTAVGSDGGWWLSLLTGRQNTMPPQYALMNERPAVSGYTKDVVTLVKELEQRPWTEEMLSRQLCYWKITHVYIGQRVGRASAGQLQLFAPQDFASWPLVYAHDRVRIFAVPEDLCQ